MIHFHQKNSVSQSNRSFDLKNSTTYFSCKKWSCCIRFEEDVDFLTNGLSCVCRREQWYPWWVSVVNRQILTKSPVMMMMTSRSRFVIRVYREGKEGGNINWTGWLTCGSHFTDSNGIVECPWPPHWSFPCPVPFPVDLFLSSLSSCFTVIPRESDHTFILRHHPSSSRLTRAHFTDFCCLF